MSRQLSSWSGFAPSVFDDLRREFGRTFPGLLEGEGTDGTLFAPRVNVAETDKAYEITADLPGMKPEEVHIEFKDGQLWISGERKYEHEEKGKTFHRIERRQGQFRRVIALGTDVDVDKVDAAYKDGVLTVHVPKAATVLPKKIAVKTS